MDHLARAGHTGTAGIEAFTEELERLSAQCHDHIWRWGLAELKIPEPKDDEWDNVVLYVMERKLDELRNLWDVLTESSADAAGILEVSEKRVGEELSWKVFISYSWDSAEHKAWVSAFAERLRGDSIDAILDNADLRFGARSPKFMERSIRDSRSVLVICTPNYKQRFDEGTGGAGYEGNVISAAILHDAGTEKFIPILRNGDWKTAVPTALGGIHGPDLRQDDEEQYRRLVQQLHGIAPKRALGPLPAWFNEQPMQRPSAGQNRGTQPLARIVSPADYGNQRVLLPASPPILTGIGQRPRWYIWSRPEQFRKARFPNLDRCAQFMRAASVRSNARWSQYPRASTTPEYLGEAIGDSAAISEGTIKHSERWLLFRSAQFIHHIALDELPQLDGRTHVFEILDVTTAHFELMARMAKECLDGERLVITFELHKVDGRYLTWPSDILNLTDRAGDNAFCQKESIFTERLYDAADLVANRRALAMDAAMALYTDFGWTNPPRLALEAAQTQRFGAPR